MSLPHILLGFLNSPASGYEMKKAFEETIQHFWSAELAQIYPTLHELRGKGLVSCVTRASAKGPHRKVYRRTPAGTQELLGWLGSPPVVGRDRFTFLAQVFFMGQLEDAKRSAQFLREMREHFQRRLNALVGIDRYHRLRDARYPARLDFASLHYYLTLRCGLARLTATVRWCDESLRLLQRCKRPSQRNAGARRRGRRMRCSTNRIDCPAR